MRKQITTTDAIMEADPSIVITDVVILLGGYVLCILILRILIPQSWDYSDTIAIFLGLIIWTIIFFFGGLCGRCLKDVPDNEVWIMADPLIQETIQSGGAINRQRKIRAQRAIQSGPNIVYPWEYLAPGGIVNMTKRSLGDEEDSNSFMTSDGNEVLIDSQFFWAPIPGYEVNFFRYHFDGGSEEKIATYLRGLRRAFLQEYCSARTLEELTGSKKITHSLDDLNDVFVEKFLSGDGLLETEERMGAQITEGAIFRIAPSKELKEILESKREAQALTEAAAEILAKNPSFTQKEAWEFACIAANKQGIDVRSVNETFALNVKGLEQMRHFAFSKLPSGGSGGSGKGKPNKPGKGKKGG
jgi:hypothetical protein